MQRLCGDSVEMLGHRSQERGYPSALAGFRIGARMDKGRRIGPDDADKQIQPGRPW
jgi:hypothetical protein